RSVPALDTFVRFQGVLNAGNSVELLNSVCLECPTPMGIQVDIVSDIEVTIQYALLAEPDSVHLRFRPLGAIEWDTLTGITSPYSLPGLTGCTNYELEFASFCA